MAEQPPGMKGLRTGIVIAAILAVLGVAAYLMRGGPAEETPPAAPESAAPAVQAPAPAPESEGAVVHVEGAPSFDIVRLSRGGTGVIAGRAKAGWRVTILADGDAVAETVADARGQWVVILEQPLAPGSRELTLVAENDAGEVLASQDLVVAAIPDTDGGGEGVVAMMTPKAGGPSRLLQRPPAPMAGNGGVLSIDTVDLLANGQIALSGSGTAGGATRLYIDDNFAGEARSDAQGYWQLVVSDPPPLTGQPVRLRADHVLAEGQVELRVEQALTVGELPELGEGVSSVVVRPGNNLWTVARLVYGAGPQYSLIFQANANQIRDPDLIYPGQVFELPGDKP